MIPELDPQAVSPDRTLASLGCNSIDRADIVTMVMEELGVSVPLDAFAKSHSLADLADLLRTYA